MNRLNAHRELLRPHLVEEFILHFWDEAEVEQGRIWAREEAQAHTDWIGADGVGLAGLVGSEQELTTIYVAAALVRAGLFWGTIPEQLGISWELP